MIWKKKMPRACENRPADSSWSHHIGRPQYPQPPLVPQNRPIHNVRRYRLNINHPDRCSAERSLNALSALDARVVNEKIREKKLSVSGYLAVHNTIIISLYKMNATKKCKMGEKGRKYVHKISAANGRGKKKNKNKKRGRRWTRRSRRSWSGRNSPRQRSQSRSMHLCQRCNASKSRVFIFQHTWHTVFAPVWVVWACSDARNAITFTFIKRWLLLTRRLDGKVRDGMLWDAMV